MDNAYLIIRIATTKTQIEAYEAAILAISTDGVEEYMLDTGQTRTRVKKQNLASMNKTLDSLYNRLCTMQARLTGGGVVTVRPAW